MPQAGGLALAARPPGANHMEDYMDSIFSLALFPFTSRTFLVLFPAACALVCAIFGLIYKLIRGDFRGIHS